jgi:hypothetical protein
MDNTTNTGTTATADEKAATFTTASSIFMGMHPSITDDMVGVVAESYRAMHPSHRSAAQAAVTMAAMTNGVTADAVVAFLDIIGKADAIVGTRRTGEKVTHAPYYGPFGVAIVGACAAAFVAVEKVFGRIEKSGRTNTGTRTTIAGSLSDIVAAGKVGIGDTVHHGSHKGVIASTADGVAIRTGGKTFVNPTAAAAIHVTYAVNGWAWWKLADGTPLGDVR